MNKYLGLMLFGIKSNELKLSSNPKIISYINRITKEQRNKGTKEQRNKGTKEQRNKGTKEQRNKGTKEQR